METLDLMPKQIIVNDNSENEYIIHNQKPLVNTVDFYVRVQKFFIIL